MKREVDLDPKKMDWAFIRMVLVPKEGGNLGRNGTVSRIVWGDGNKDKGEKCFSCIVDGKEHTYFVPLFSYRTWGSSGTVKQIRFLPLPRAARGVDVKLGKFSIYEETALAVFKSRE